MLLQPGHGPLPFVHVATLGYVALVYLGVAATGVCLLRGTNSQCRGTRVVCTSTGPLNYQPALGNHPA
jgi:hypothetical protein